MRWFGAWEFFQFPWKGLYLSIVKFVLPSQENLAQGVLGVLLRVYGWVFFPNNSIMSKQCGKNILT